MYGLWRTTLGLLVLAAAPALAQPAPPTPPAVTAHVAAYVAAVNGGSAATQAFRDHDIAPAFATAVPPKPFARYFVNQHRVTGGLDLVAIRMSSPTLAEAVVRDRVYGGLHGFAFTLTPDADAKVVDFEPGPAPAWARTTDKASLPPETVGAQAAALVARGCKAGVFSGAVLVARGDRVLLQTACGEASRRYHAANTVATRFNLGSMDKMFTSLAVMQLVEAGKVSLDDPLSKYADETWLAPDVARKITVRQLLTHTSGLGDFFNETFRKSSRELYREVDDYKPLVRGGTLAFEPGTRFQYSDTGMLMLGVVIEKASGENYFDYVRRHVTGPAGMTRTDNYPLDEPVEDLAMGYIYAPDTPGGWRENTFAHVLRGGPAGGGYSTVGDLNAFAHALEADTLVSAKTKALMWTDAMGHGYGMGFELGDGAAGHTVGHTGFFSGVSTRMTLYLDRGYTVVVLSNIDVGAPALSDAIGDVVARAR